MNTENIIENLLNGNIAAAKEETENILLAKVGEVIDYITDDVTASVFGIQEKKKKKDDDEDEKYADVTDKEDDGEGLDPVDAEDDDVDNDGDEDESDDYLKNRRKVRKKEVEESKGGDGRGEFIYGMKINRYDKLSDDQKAQVKQVWYNEKAEEEKAKGIDK